jgi:plasmid stabilization system protein ParE
LQRNHLAARHSGPSGNRQICFLRQCPAAERLGYALIDAALSLATFPERGRLVPEFADGKTREIIYTQYRIVYRVDAASKTVSVSRFWHGARLLTRDTHIGTD